ncbi:hypothetical protein F8154_10140 [Alkaliphilus pronyensis]|uniref:Uncharacterized protein n=1 Tax=Alkaliphilus pronyensis TaxID=1482732 RepID=A0A6I0EXN8_9FIRM|nr:hypothetical protein [Alkaliphilus pronyensis]KAB3534031.1 hypothetical protein F8154_10140 [Alkaliphilus pronyensis]
MNIEKKIDIINCIIALIMIIGVYVIKFDFVYQQLLLILMMIIRLKTNTSRIRKLEKEVEVLKNINGKI